MKNLFLCAFALIAFTGSSFASNGGPDESQTVESSQNKPCKFKLIAYKPGTDPEEVIASEVFTGNEGKDACFERGLIEQEKWAIKYPGANIIMEIIN